jgi:NAD(P)-dependent dehydrogenase (short-subunit alcohol dehydrogenase family)
MLLTAAFLDATRAWRGQRRVLNISSGLGRRPMASQAAYCAAKAGLDLFTRCVALDEAGQPNGARVCSLAPGVIDTDMQVHLRGADAAAFPDRANFEQLKTAGQLASPKPPPGACWPTCSAPTSATTRWPTCAIRPERHAAAPAMTEGIGFGGKAGWCATLHPAMLQRNKPPGSRHTADLAAEFFHHPQPRSLAS